ncbi:phage terminase small subunit P27 family [Mesorhizobium sp. J428]|uniref:phage terminase small subunit P27 family n=1 Tax=Mesorhizobium sp. J428 TaxID=2898440 RepID=UPI002151360C|nr:phage terminase small subunit P27 family [Mesorhizobium sp. J428]MCR5856577.1 phage terminase small subunit P27 family [Mesorhizobium sp. J428]
MKGRKAELRVIEGGLDHVPDVPAHIPAAVVEEWRGIIIELTERKVLTDAMRGSVDAYVMALHNAREAQKAIETHGLLVASGKDGVLKQNPAVSLLGKATQTIMRLAVELGLTPVARSKAVFRPPAGEEDDLFSKLLS